MELARRFNGEVLNADAMQLYKGLPIITNKITSGEQRGVPHHLLGCIGLDEQPWTVGNFVTSALSTIADIHNRGNVPIMVGGTHYYTQSLLFHDSLASCSATNEPSLQHDTWSNEKPSTQLAKQWPILKNGSTSEILEKLKEVDPFMARRWHPNDHRKIQRSLEIYLQTGRKASEIYQEQRARRRGQRIEDDGLDGSAVENAAVDQHVNCDELRSGGGAGVQGSLRMPTLILWLHADTSVLYPRLDARVEKMLKRGLLDEVKELSQYAANHSSTIDQSSGIWVSIGYKEFLPYMSYLNSTHKGKVKLDDSKGNDDDDDDDDKNDTMKVEDRQAKALLQQAIEATQAGTRQYAKRQLRWIRIKLIDALMNGVESQAQSQTQLQTQIQAETQMQAQSQAQQGKASSSQGQKCLYVLDGNDTSAFEEQVIRPAVDLMNRFLQEGRGGSQMPDPCSISEKAAEVLSDCGRKRYGKLAARGGGGRGKSEWQRKECHVCGVVGTTESDWVQHIQGRRHKKLVGKKNKGQGLAE